MQKFLAEASALLGKRPWIVSSDVESKRSSYTSLVPSYHPSSWRLPRHRRIEHKYVSETAHNDRIRDARRIRHAPYFGNLNFEIRAVTLSDSIQICARPHSLLTALIRSDFGLEMEI